MNIQQNIQATLNNTLKLLVKYPNLRAVETRKTAIWKYWQEFEGAGDTIELAQFRKLTNPETISRAIRYWVKKRPDLLKREQEAERQRQAEEYKRKFEALNRKTEKERDEEMLRIAMS